MSRLVRWIRGDHDERLAPERVINAEKNAPRNMSIKEIQKALEGLRDA